MSHGFELIEENGKSYYAHVAKGIYPIHPLPTTLKEQLRVVTHHYSGVFTKEVFIAIPDKVFVDNVEYDVNKKERLLIISYDGKLNLWQCAPTFKSDRYFKSGYPILNSTGEIVSIIIGSTDGRYAISCFDGYSGKFETGKEWLVNNDANGIIYGDKVFQSREELKAYLEGRQLADVLDIQPILVENRIPRIILFDLNSGLEISHSYVRGNFTVELCEKYH